MNIEFYTFENLEDVWVKSWEQRDGLAVCSTSDVNLVTTFNPGRILSFRCSHV